MNMEPQGLSRLADADTQPWLEQKRFEIEFTSVSGQLQNFGPLRDRLSATGEDANAYYLKLRARRDELLKSLKKITPTTNGERQLASRDLSLSKLVRPPGLTEGGSSGFVQLPPASEGPSLTPGLHPFVYTGRINTVPGYNPGDIGFQGHLNVAQNHFGGTVDIPGADYFWIHTWMYLVPFPAPSAPSRFNYSFDVTTLMNFAFSSGDTQANIASWVGIGETASLMTGETIALNPTAGGFTVGPTDLSAPSGRFDNSGNFRRSFNVAAGQVPGIIIVVGVSAALSVGADLQLGLNVPCEIDISSNSGLGRISYSFQPEVIALPLAS
jgi:hypothetical protein